MVSGGEVVLCLESVCLLLPTASCKLQRLLGIAGLQMSSGKEERFSAILTYNLILLRHYCNMYTFAADGQHTAAPECDPVVGMLPGGQHLCTLPVHSTLFCALRLAYLYPLPLLFRQPLMREPAASSCRQLHWKAAVASR